MVLVKCPSKVLRGILVVALVAMVAGAAFWWKDKTGKIIISHKDDFEIKKISLEVMGDQLGALIFCRMGDIKEEGERVEAWALGKHKKEEGARLLKAFADSIKPSLERGFAAQIVAIKAGPPSDDEKCKRLKAEYDRFVLE
jgi:hypothetical protein